MPSSKHETTRQLRAQYVHLLTFLEGYGALLHVVSPESLFPKDLYLRAHMPRVKKGMDTSSPSASIGAAMKRKGQWHALVACYGRHRWPVRRSN